MRSECGSSLAAVLAALLIVGVLAATLAPKALHPSSAPSTPAPQDALTSARTAVQAVNARQASP